MILADKIIRLRKKNGWSQEELAEKVNVSRQAVSKWEGAQTVPDLDKLLTLATLFGVTTDYLLKDEIEDEEFTDEDTEPSVKKVSLQDASDFLALRKKASTNIALAIFLYILSPICLLIFGAASELPSFPLSENLAGGIGLIVLFLIAATATGIVIYTGFQSSSYQFLEKGPFETEYGVVGLVREKQKAYRNTYVKFNIIGTILCVLSPISIFVGMFIDTDIVMAAMLCVTLLIAGVGVIFFITAGVRQASFQKLLKEGDYTPVDKQENRIQGAVASIYWPVVVAIYLGWSFIAQNWGISWVVWPIAGVLFGAVMAICNLFNKNDKNK